MWAGWTGSWTPTSNWPRLDLGAGLKHHRIPRSWIEYVDDDKVHLSLTADAAKAAWREKH